MTAVKRIKIIHVLRSLATGGTENIVRRLIECLDPGLFDQKVCTLMRSSGETQVGAVSLDCTQRGRQFLVPRLARVLWHEKPDIVHSRNWATIEAIVAARLCRVPAIVHSEHGRDLQTLGRQPLRRRVLRRLAYRWTDQLFCVSQELKQYYCRELNWGTSRFEVIPNGVNSDQFCPNPQARTEMRAKLGVKGKTLVIGSVGRLDPVKDHITLLRAAGMALGRGVDLRLVLVGDGIQRSNIKNELARNPDLAGRTTMTGDTRNVVQWLNAFDVFVLPSLSEGMSNTLLEAMAVGVAPIATAVGGNGEVIENGQSGILVQLRDPEEICCHITVLAADEARRARLGRNARERIAQTFSLDRMLERYAEMYCQLVEPRKRGNPVLSRA